MLRGNESGSGLRARRRRDDTLKTRRATLAALAGEITRCRLCPRLVEHRETIARNKRRAFADWTYWGKPLAGFGDPQARLLILGLAPAAHGGNRTGRVFTGDRSGDWLYATLYRFAFANQPTSRQRDDGLTLIDAFVTAAVRCAPPDNKPTRDELAHCTPYLQREILLLPRVRIVVALGRFAFDAYLSARAGMNLPAADPRPKFAHAAVYELDDVALVASYHPSQRNTQTGFLTQPMFDQVFRIARERIAAVDTSNRRG